MSHELRTPLNIIIGFSEVLINSANIEDRQKRYAENIYTSGKQLLLLINDVLDLAKMEAGKLAAKPEHIDAGKFFDSTVGMFRQHVEEKNIELKLDVPANLTLHQDAGKLRQILTNLLSNAVKFTPDGGRITVTAEEKGDMLAINVEDTGIGIAPEEQAMIFQKFRQTENPLTREQGGTGLGLSIVRELSRLLGGDVILHSELGSGSRFTVTVKKEIKSIASINYDDDILD